MALYMIDGNNRLAPSVRQSLGGFNAYQKRSYQPRPDRYRNRIHPPDKGGQGGYSRFFQRLVHHR